MKSTEEILEDIFTEGKTTYKFTILKKYSIEIRNITSKDFLEIDEALKDNTSTKIGLAQNYLLERISRIILSIKDKTFKTPEDCKTFLLSMSSTLSDKILEEHKKFEKQIKKALEIEEVEDAFFDKDASQQK